MQGNHCVRQMRFKLASLVIAVAMLVVDLSGSFALAQAQSQPAQVLVGEAADCTGATALATGGVGLRGLQRQQKASPDWLKFTVQQGKRYRIHVAAGQVKLGFALFDGCDETSLSYTAPQGEIAFTAQRDATYYARVAGAAVQSAATPGTYMVTLSDLADPPPSKIALKDAPLELHRRALDLLEEMRGNPEMPDWNAARLSAEVRLLYRPDLTTATYYEFLVEKPGPNGFEPAGFIQVSANQDDYPVTNWSATGLSPTQGLEDLASTGGDVPTQFFKVDVLSFVAEYEQVAPLGITVVATDVLQIGQLPPKFTGFDTLPLDFGPSTTEVNWTHAMTTTDDSATTVITPTRVVIGPDEPEALSLEEWGSWADLKRDYNESYGVILADLKQEASTEWNYVANVRQNGESLLNGDTRTIRAMSSLSVTEVTVTGAGAETKYLQQEPLNSDGLAQGVRITVVGEPAGERQELPVDVTIRYTSGMTEAKHFVIINATSLQAPNTVYLPVVTNGSNQQAVVAAGVDAPTVVQWGPWTEWWAAGVNYSNQWPLYNQIRPFTRVNNRPCHSGCTPTAWAMLFAWADRRAATLGSGWTHRFGIYRQNGGYGADAVAPLRESDDRGIENVMIELGSHMGTFCQGDQGATYVNRQGDAQRYLTPRTSATVRAMEANGWWIFGTSEDDTTNRAIGVLKGGEPVVIMTPGHSPMAMAYRERSRRVRHCFIFCWYTTDYQREFYINQGWGAAYYNQWINARTRFAGDIQAN